MTTHRKPSDILRAIGERIGRPEAWTRREFARDAEGRPCGSAFKGATCWCWLGARNVEIGPIEDVDLRKSVRAYMEMVIGGGVAAWNDTHTHAEVLAANARAIRLAEEAGE